jgi:hypothetical protein
MSPYRTIDLVKVKFFRAASLDELEVMMNEWLHGTKREIRDITYHSQHHAVKEIHTSLITYSPLEYEPPM